MSLYVMGSLRSRVVSDRRFLPFPIPMGADTSTLVTETVPCISLSWSNHPRLLSASTSMPPLSQPLGGKALTSPLSTRWGSPHIGQERTQDIAGCWHCTRTSVISSIPCTDRLLNYIPWLPSSLLNTSASSPAGFSSRSSTRTIKLDGERAHWKAIHWLWKEHWTSSKFASSAWRQSE